jgi:hypothetical protein
MPNEQRKYADETKRMREITVGTFLATRLFG